MITTEVRNYRNFLVQHEDHLISGKIKINNLKEWQNLYENLLSLRRERKSFSKDENEELNKYLILTDDYLNSLLTAMKLEMTLYKQNKISLTDENITLIFADVIILVSAESIKRKLQILEDIAKKENSNLDNYVLYVNNFGVNFRIPKKFAVTYENLLLSQIEINSKFNEIINKIILAEEGIFNSEEEILPDLFNFNFYYSLNFEGKKDYLERVINKILESKAKVKVNVNCFGKSYEIPRYYKALFLELSLQLKFVNLRILKREENFVMDNEGYISKYEEKSSYQVKNLQDYNIPSINIDNLKKGELTAKLTDVISKINKLVEFAKRGKVEDVILFEDEKDTYYILKEHETEFLKLYFLKKNLEKDQNNFLKEIKSKISFLKCLPTTEGVKKEIERLTLIFREEKKKNALNEEGQVKALFKNCPEEESNFYVKVLLNINGFIHSKKFDDKFKIDTLKNILHFLTEETEYYNEVQRYLNYLSYDSKNVLLISDIRKMKNMEKFANNLNKSSEFIANEIITFSVANENESTTPLLNNMENDLNSIRTDVQKLKEKAFSLQEDLTNIIASDSLTKEFFKRRNTKEIAALNEDDDILIMYNDSIIKVNAKDEFGKSKCDALLKNGGVIIKDSKTVRRVADGNI